MLIGLDETVALLFLRMDVLGVLDLERRLLSLDAALVNLPVPRWACSAG